MIKNIEELYREEDAKDPTDYGVKHRRIKRTRMYEEKESCSFGCLFIRDRDRIYHSRFFKRLTV
jgi:hypothetical protein